MIFRKITLPVVLLLLEAGTACLHAQEDWTLRKEKDGIIIHTRASSASPLKEYRISATIRAPLNKVYEFLSDISLRPEWVYNCSAVNIIDRTPGRITYHTLFDIPWPVQDRDLVATVLTTWTEDSSRVRILTEEVKLDYIRDRNVVRMPEYREDVILEKMDDGHTLYRTEGFADPGGQVPPWLTNLFLVDGPYDSMVRTREHVEKD